MFKNYLLLTFMNLRKHKVFSLINILGLTVSITCCVLIFLFIRHETSFDNFHTKGKNIYRVVRQTERETSGGIQDVAWVSGPYAIALKNDYPDAIKRAVRVRPDNFLFRYQNISFNEKKVYATDTNFFELFDFKLLKGNAATVLTNPESVVLTASTAKKYFGSEDPMGKILEMENNKQMKVTGIAEDVPSNSHLNFDMIVSIANFSQSDSMKNFPYNNLYTYIELMPNVSKKQMESRFPKFMDKYMGDYFAKAGFKMGLGLEPLNEIYFKEMGFSDQVKHGNKKVIFIFMSIAILILVIACINFMNLATARAADRSKEVGLRKVLGALRGQLLSQFLLESFVYAALSSVMALILLQLVMPAYSTLLGYKLPSFWGEPATYIFLLGIIVVIGLLAGIYPALLLSSFSPIDALRAKLRIGKGGAFFRKTLVVFQFSISVMLIICITIITVQMRYVRNTELGFNKEQTLLLRIDGQDFYKNRLLFKKIVENDPGVISASLMSGEPGGFRDRQGFESENKPGESFMMGTEFSDFEIVKTLGLKIIAGRDFSAQFPTDSTQAMLVTRAAVTQMGYASPEAAIGKRLKNLTMDTTSRRIVGVLEDFHFSSLKDKITPMIFSVYPDHRVAAIRLKPNTNLKSTIDRIKATYAGISGGYPFEYNFLDESFDQQYKNEQQQDTILSIFSGIAIFVACLGLFGLASYTAIKRTKEIGVRKVLGSSVQSIVMLLSKDLLKPVMLGTLVAIPIGYYVMGRWLEGFAYRTNMQWWMFLIAAMVAIFIAIITVSYQAIKAALANPVNSLRTE